MTDPLNVTPTIDAILRDMYETQINRNTDRTPFDGPTLRQLRMAKRVTRAELAHKMGVSPYTIKNWESGRNRPSSFDVRLLAEHMTRWSR